MLKCEYNIVYLFSCGNPLPSSGGINNVFVFKWMHRNFMLPKNRASVLFEELIAELLFNSPMRTAANSGKMAMSSQNLWCQKLHGKHPWKYEADPAKQLEKLNLAF